MEPPDKPTPAQLLAEARDAARTYQKLVTCYRVGSQPSEKLFKELEKANAAMRRWRQEEAAEEPTGQ